MRSWHPRPELSDKAAARLNIVLWSPCIDHCTAGAAAAAPDCPAGRLCSAVSTAPPAARFLPPAAAPCVSQLRPERLRAAGSSGGRVQLVGVEIPRRGAADSRQRELRSGAMPPFLFAKPLSTFPYKPIMNEDNYKPFVGVAQSSAQMPSLVRSKAVIIAIKYFTSYLLAGEFLGQLETNNTSMNGQRNNEYKIYKRLYIGLNLLLMLLVKTT